MKKINFKVLLKVYTFSDEKKDAQNLMPSFDGLKTVFYACAI